MELKAEDEERAEAKRREEEPKRAYDEKLERMFDRAQAMQAQGIRSL
jgi:hypothetical protein